jgi:hypothetical protein
MVPTVELPPEMPLTLHVTAVFVVLITVAVKSCVPPTGTDAAAGSTLTAPAGGVGGELGFTLVAPLHTPTNEMEARMRIGKAWRAARFCFFLTNSGEARPGPVFRRGTSPASQRDSGWAELI